MKSAVFTVFGVLAIGGVLVFGLDICGTKSFLTNQVSARMKPVTVETPTNSSAEIVAVETDGADFCKPLSAEKRKLQTKFNKKFAALVKERKEIANGFAYIFSSSNTNLEEVEEFIKNEQECCPFLSFTIDSQSHKNEIWVEATGADGKDKKEYLETFLAK